MKDMSMSWEEKLKTSEAVIAEHRQLLSHHAASVTGIGSALKLGSKLPHFISMSQDLDFEVTIYTFKYVISR